MKNTTNIDESRGYQLTKISIISSDQNLVILFIYNIIII